MNIIGMIKKYGVIALCAIALISLFFPMASVSIDSDYYESTTSVSGFTVALQGYVAMLLIVGPIAIAAADYVAQIKPFKKLIMLAAPAVCIIVTFIAFLQAKGIAAGADSGWVDVSASMGFGGVLCLISHIGILVFGIIENKDTIMSYIKK